MIRKRIKFNAKSPTGAVRKIIYAEHVDPPDTGLENEASRQPVISEAFVLDDGQRLERIAKGKYKLPDGTILTSSDPNAV